MTAIVRISELSELQRKLVKDSLNNGGRFIEPPETEEGLKTKLNTLDLAKKLGVDEIDVTQEVKNSVCYARREEEKIYLYYVKIRGGKFYQTVWISEVQNKEVQDGNQ